MTEQTGLISGPSYYEVVGSSNSYRTRSVITDCLRFGRKSTHKDYTMTSIGTDDIDSLFEAAASNNVKKFSTLLSEDPSKLQLKDGKGWTPLHRAADRGSTDVLVILFQYGADLNQLTGDQETALHLAVRQGQCLVIELLLNNGADGTIKNSWSLTPAHLAVQLHQHDSLKSLFKDKKIDPHVPGEFSMTPLHLAACLDDVEAAKIMLDNGAYLCHTCALGLTILHYAAKNASKNVLNLVLDIAESKGYTREALLSRQDKHKHSALHSAINSGNTEPVKVCLEAGAKICSKQADGSTPVHLVCSQGALNIVQLMKEVQPDEFKKSLSTQDDNGMTPLHRAVLFNYAELAQYLINQGSPLNIADCNGKTPILVAASRLCWDCAKVLYHAGANICAKDVENSNFIHLAIKNVSGSDDLWKSPVIQGICNRMMNETDIYGCTPIHYASKDGNLSSLCGLLKTGAVITCKDNSKQSPLHFASKYGRVNTCRTLLDAPQGAFIINEVNHEGKTALHLAAEFGHVKVVALLMQRGALLHRDYQGDNPLHLAARSGYTQTMKLLLNVHPSTLSTENNAGNTPLHEAAVANKPKSVNLLLSMEADITENKEYRTFLDIAIEKANSEATTAAVTHSRWKEILKSPSKVHGSYMLGLVKYLPDVAITVMDQCTESSSHDTNSREYNVTYHFDLINSKSIPSATVNDSEQDLKETSHAVPLSMVKYERINCLSHPLCLQYVKMKWNSIGLWLHFLNVLLYVIFLGCYTSIIMSIGPTVMQTPATQNLTDTDSVTLTDDYMEYRARVKQAYPQMIIVIILLLFNVIKEFLQMVQLTWRYFLDFSNVMEWTIYITAALYIIPNLVDGSYEWSYICGVIALFFAWVNFLLFLQRFELTGIYVVMFRGILKTLIQVLVVFSILIFAFGFTFYALLREEEKAGFTSIGMSTFTSIVMMIGEMNYLDWFVTPSIDGDPRTLRFQKMSFVILSLFLLLMPILLMNLLIGLAVGDIDSVLKNARLKRLAMQVELTSEFEQKLPEFIIARFHKSSLTEYPNGCKTVMRTMFESMMTGSSKDNIQHHEKNELYSIVMQQKVRIKELQNEMRTQTELLKLVVEKMEIKTESSYLDEGSQDENIGISLILRQASASSNAWRSKAMTGAMTKVKAASRFGCLVERTISDDSNNPDNKDKGQITPTQDPEVEFRTQL